MSEEEFIKKAHDLTAILLKKMAEFTKNEEADIAAKIALLTLSKASASVICAMEKNFEVDTESVLDLFVGTVSESVALVGNSENSTKHIIDKMMGKQ